MNIIGVDLAAKQKNPTGICSLNQKTTLFTLYTNQDITDTVQNCQPDLIALDAPLIKGKIRIREADRYLRRYGALPPTMSSMTPLVRRGSKLAEVFLAVGYEVIEVFPTATAKILGVYSQDYKLMAQKFGIQPRNEHEMDAFLAAFTGRLKMTQKAIEIGDDDGKVVLPMEKNEKSS
jgi:predicted nuclease with RNAse H fold